ncbi:hypothetical protein J3E72DRAFT_363164 [Bipolaris maydis]|nr:hypothetical protein J3E72DRAFT_363164 [Bipolaris maydis]
MNRAIVWWLAYQCVALALLACSDFLTRGPCNNSNNNTRHQTVYSSLIFAFEISMRYTVQARKLLAGYLHLGK